VDRDMAEQLAIFGHHLDPDIERMDGKVLPKLDLLLSLGGDGTFLDSVAMTGRSGIPVLGINLGRLGFLSNIRLEGSERAMEALANGRFTIEERALLEMSGCEGFSQHPYALNEMSLHKRDSSSMIAVHAYLGDRFLNTYWADGLIVATPTGSTAYSLSCGGPLLAPDCDAMVITPISPHNLNVRPFVVPGNSVVRLIVEARGDKYLVNLDSRSTAMDRATEIILRRADHRAKLVHLEGQEFMNTLRDKLNWGLDVRSIGPPGTVFNEE
jgi:NAD+ kinase